MRKLIFQDLTPLAVRASRARGFSVIGWLLVIPVVLVVLLLLTIGFYEGRKAYWDAQVKKMCARDGGVQIFEKLRISRAQVQSLGVVGGMIGIPAKELAKPDVPVYEELKITDIRDANPRVSRSEILAVRRTDKVTLARAIIYARSGGDFPSYAHPSFFSCPEFKSIISDLQHLFSVEGDAK